MYHYLHNIFFEVNFCNLYAWKIYIFFKPYNICIIYLNTEREINGKSLYSMINYTYYKILLSYVHAALVIYVPVLYIILSCYLCLL